MDCWRKAGVMLAMGLSVGCGEVPSGVGRGAMAAPAGSECPVANYTQPCSDCGAGRQVCTSALTWGNCQCASEDGAAGGSGSASTPAGNLRGDIVFEWEETASGSTSGGTGDGLCIPGTYEGSYMFDFVPVALGAPIPTVGPFVIVFGTERDGEFLVTAAGSTLEVHFLEPVINANCVLDGGVNCNTGEFEASTVDCLFDSLGIPAGPIFAELDGMFDPVTQNIDGMIVSEAPGFGGGMGTFTMTLLP